jgi:glycosyltransferase involved in cell wall biosynthesis
VTGPFSADGGAGSPLASVVVPTRLRPDLLARQLESLAAQDYAGSWEVIVADNAGDAPTRAVVARFAGRVPGIQWVDASHQKGGAAVRNAGAAVARGDYFLFLDDDDEADAGYVRCLVDGLDDHDFVAARLEHDSLNTNWVARALSPWQTDRLLDTWGFLTYANGGSLGIRRDVFKGAGGWLEESRYSDDIFFCWAVQLSGATLHLVDGAVLHYRHRTSPREFLAQEWRSGLGDLALYRRFAEHGMPFPTPGWGQQPSRAFLADLVRSRNQGEVLVWTGDLVRRVSRIRAARAYRRKVGQ